MLVKIGTRGSKLAMAQTGYVIDRLSKAFPEHQFQSVVITTTGDKDLTSPLDAIGSKGLFVDEIERALISGDIQMAVHSMKDMPDTVGDGLVFAKSWVREDPRDVLILKEGASLDDLAVGAVVGTGSKRRAYQLKKLRPDLQIVNIRGNVDTRLKKLKEGLADGTELDGIVLAVAGLNRLGLQDNISYIFDVDEMIPAPAQGYLAIELREDNAELMDMINSLSDDDSQAITFLERGFMEAIGGDCHMPIAAYADRIADGYRLRVLFGSEDGSSLATAVVEGPDANQDLIYRAVEAINKKLND